MNLPARCIAGTRHISRYQFEDFERLKTIVQYLECLDILFVLFLDTVTKYNTKDIRNS